MEETELSKRHLPVANIAAVLWIVAMLLLPNHANAVGWVSKTRIARLVVHDWGDSVFVYTETAASTEVGCTGSTFVLLRSNPQFKEIYAAALLAQQARSTIGGFTYGCDPGHYNLPILQRIDVLTDPNVVYP